MGTVRQQASSLQSPSTETPSSVAMATVDQVTLDIFHESGIDNVGGPIRQTRLIPPSERMTVVSVTSTVISAPAERMNSPEYLASIRRRTCSRIKGAVISLAKKSHVDDFAVYTFKPFNETVELLAQLSNVQSEGNTRAILRQIRDTFIDGCHERYREARFRDLIAKTLQRLADAFEVTSDDVDDTWDALYDHGMALPIQAIFQSNDLKNDSDG